MFVASGVTTSIPEILMITLTQAGGIDSLESIHGLLKRLQIRALVNFNVPIFLSASAYKLIALNVASIL